METSNDLSESWQRVETCSHLPCVVVEDMTYVIKQQTWFMKSLAIELRVTSLNQQRSHTQRLIGCLLDSTNSTFSHTAGEKL